MPDTFTHRNVFYLRTSPYAVLQTILYLDHRHVAWFNANPHILPSILRVLKARIMPKLRREADPNASIGTMSKKEKVDVYSDSEYQLAYFFRKMDDRHAVLLKEKSLVFPETEGLGEVKVEQEGRANQPIPSGGGRVQPITVKDEEVLEATRSVRWADSPPDRNSGLFRRVTSISDDDEESSTPLRRSKRQRTTAPPIKDDPDSPPAHDDDDEDVQQNDAIPVTAEEEEKMKPKLSVKYSGFRIFGKLLILVVEPTKRVIAANPELFGEKQTQEVRQLSVAPGSVPPSRRSATPVQARFTSLASSRDGTLPRGPTPLFRDMTPMSESGTPAPMMPPPPVPRAESEEVEASDPVDDEELEGFQMATQMLERDGLSVGGGNDIEEGD